MNRDEILRKSKYGYKGDNKLYNKLLEIIAEEKENVKERLHCTMQDFFVRGVIEYVTDLITGQYFTENLLTDPTYTIEELQTVLESKYRGLLKQIQLILCYRGGKYDRAFSIVANYIYYVYVALLFYIDNSEDGENEKE